MHRVLPLLPILALGFLPCHPLAGQSVVDEGTFRITIDGRDAGTETFSIRRLGAGAEMQIFATAEILLQVPEGRLDLQPMLRALGEDMAVSAYQVKVSGHQQEELTVELDDRRFRTTIRSERSEREREYRATPQTLVLETRAAHQYYFVAQRAGTGGATMPVILPRDSRQYELRVSVVGRESIEIGGQRVEARHLRLEGDRSVRNLWVDDAGRVLRLEVEDLSYVAVRERLP